MGKFYRHIFLLACGLLLTALFLQAESTRWKWSGISRIVAIADLHGDFDAFVEILQGTDLIGDDVDLENPKWLGGETHLVQLGDVMDRGIDGHHCFNLLMKLEKQAEEAGGKVHVLIGNHEEANISGTAPTTSDYVAPMQFWYFLGPEYVAKREKPIRDKYNGSSNNNEVEEKVLQFWEKVQADSDDEALDIYRESFVKQYGEWLISKNVVTKINDIVFAHGGVNETFSEMDIGEVNKLMRADLNKLKLGKRLYAIPKVAYNPNAPQWFRGLIREDEESFSDDVDRILANLEANYMVVGHTVRKVRKLDRFGGRIWGIDTGNSKFYGGVRCALIVEDGNFRIWWADAGIEDVTPDSGSDQRGQVKIDQKEMEAFLRMATILTAIPDENLGRTEPWIIDLKDGEIERKGFFKHVNRCRPSAQADCYKYELAAYEMSKLLGLEIILPVVERVIKARPGSLAMFLPSSWVSLKKINEGNTVIKEEEAFHINMLDILVFDNLCYTGLEDEDLNEDIYVDPETGFVCRTDFSQGFAPAPALIPLREVTHCSDMLRQNLADLDDNAIRKAMKPFLNEQEIAALIVRKNMLLDVLAVQK